MYINIILLWSAIYLSKVSLSMKEFVSIDIKDFMVNLITIKLMLLKSFIATSNGS